MTWILTSFIVRLIGTGTMATMADRERASDFRLEFIERTKTARTRSGLTQDEMAKLLGLDQGTYKQYETRSLLPHRYIPAFCMITRVSESWLLSGKGRPRVST